LPTTQRQACVDLRGLPRWSRGIETILLLKHDELTRLGYWFAARQADLVEREAQEVTRLLGLKLERQRAAAPGRARRSWCDPAATMRNRYVAPTPPAKA
jgi:hypothetical protein